MLKRSAKQKVISAFEGDIIDRVRKWSIRNDVGKNIIERVEDLARASQIPAVAHMRMLPMLLKGKALQKWRMNRKNSTWQKWNDV